MSNKNSTNLEQCVTQGDENALIDLVYKYFGSRELKDSYIIEPVCPEGLSRLYCGYFKGQYGLIEIELVGLYPAELEEIENKLFPNIQAKIAGVPRVRGSLPFSFETTDNSAILRFYAKVSDPENPNKDIISVVSNELAPALILVTRFLKKEADIYD